MELFILRDKSNDVNPYLVLGCGYLKGKPKLDVFECNELPDECIYLNYKPVKSFDSFTGMVS